VPLNESKRAIRRARYPLEFELAAVPPDERDRLLAARRAEINLAIPIEGEEETMSPVTVTKNTFAVDYQQENVIDINNPATKRYRHQEFPKMVYNHIKGHVLVVANAKQHAAALKRGFQDEPDPNRDYSKVKSGMIAPTKEAGPERELPLTDADLDELEAQSAADLEQAVAEDEAEEPTPAPPATQSHEGRHRKQESKTLGHA
jgi:hypothetical protein